jgi:hypothetical protein
MMYRTHYTGGADRFDNYCEIAARFDSTGACGHAIHKGDVIGWNRRARKARCTDCWTRWVAENAEADAMEAGHVPTCW